MEFKVKIIKPEFDKNPHKSISNNSEWRRVVSVEFENMLIKETDSEGFTKFGYANFQWLPTYKQLCQIYRALEKCETVNKELCAVWGNR